MGRRVVPLPAGSTRFWIALRGARDGADLVAATETDGRIGWSKDIATEAKRFDSKRDADRFVLNRIPALARGCRYTLLPGQIVGIYDEE